MANKQQLQSAGDGTAVPAGYVGERAFAQSTTANITGAAASIRGVGTLSIPSAGVWLISSTLFAQWSGAPGGASLILSTVSATSTSFPQHGMGTSSFTDMPMSTQEGNSRIANVHGVLATFTGPATLYINAYTLNNVSATNAQFTAVAIRIA